jgi:hypothetical protein
VPFGYSCAVFGDRVEDLIGGLGPDEWSGVLVPGLDPCLDVFVEGGAERWVLRLSFSWVSSANQRSTRFSLLLERVNREIGRAPMSSESSPTTPRRGQRQAITPFTGSPEHPQLTPWARIVVIEARDTDAIRELVTKSGYRRAPRCRGPLTMSR